MTTTRHGPEVSNENGDLSFSYLKCGNCVYRRVHDGHYFYCRKLGDQTKADCDPYNGGLKRLHSVYGEPDKDCPYITDQNRAFYGFERLLVKHEYTGQIEHFLDMKPESKDKVPTGSAFKWNSPETAPTNGTRFVAVIRNKKRIRGISFSEAYYSTSLKKFIYEGWGNPENYMITWAPWPI